MNKTERFGWYYLHKNGDMIFKPYMFEPDTNSPFVTRVWRVDREDRGTAWHVLLEGLGLNANLERCKQLADLWGCTRKDLLVYMSRNLPTQAEKKGMVRFLEEIHKTDTRAWFEWLNTQIGKIAEEVDCTNMPGEERM